VKRFWRREGDHSTLRGQPRDAEEAHRLAQQLSAERLDEPLDGDSAQWLEDHLEGCVPCATIAGAYAADRAELRALNASIAAALAKASDRETRAHLEGTRDQIAKILDPKFAQPAPGVPNAQNRAGMAEPDPFSPGFDSSEICWPDYVIRP